MSKLTQSQKAELAQRYRLGENTIQLSAAYGVSRQAIGRALKLMGVERRPRFGATSLPDSSIVEQVCRQYQEGATVRELSSAYQVSTTTVYNYLKQAGIRRPDSGRKGGVGGKGGNGGAFPSDLKQEALKRYLSGEDTPQIAASYSVSKYTVCRWLAAAGVERRERGGFGDTIRDAVEGTGRHAQAVKTSFYLFDLARYAETHCKVGIAYDARHRAHNSQGEYGTEHFRADFATRREALFLEQAVLDATRGNAEIPAGISAEWKGASEIRAIPAKDMLVVIERLAAELKRLGEWDFAAHYVPMPAELRLACQQRALQPLITAD